MNKLIKFLLKSFQGNEDVPDKYFEPVELNSDQSYEDNTHKITLINITLPVSQSLFFTLVMGNMIDRREIIHVEAPGGYILPNEATNSEKFIFQEWLNSSESAFHTLKDKPYSDCVLPKHRQAFILSLQVTIERYLLLLVQLKCLPDWEANYLFKHHIRELRDNQNMLFEKYFEIEKSALNNNVEKFVEEVDRNATSDYYSSKKYKK